MSEFLLNRAMNHLARLVAIPSPSGDEAAICEYVAGALKAAGMAVEMQSVGNRANVIGRTAATTDRALLLTGHLDTVPAGDGWTTDPHTLEQDGDHLIGRGAADQKAGLAAQIAAVEALSADGLLDSKDILVVFTCDEEALSDGMRVFLKDGPKASVALLSEPFWDPVVTGSPGKVLLKITVIGKAAHGGTPEEGKNAVDEAGRLLVALVAESDRQVSELMGTTFPAQRFTTLSISGGYERYSLTVPDRCVVTTSKQLVPGENHETIVRLASDIAKRNGIEVSIEVLPPYYPPSHMDANTDAVLWFRALYRDVFGVEPTFGWGKHVCDQDLLLEAGIPTICFGPRGDRLHQPGEWVSTAAMKKSAELYFRACLSK